MSVGSFWELHDHVGHQISCVRYVDSEGDVQNVALECETCFTVLLDYDRPRPANRPAKQRDEAKRFLEQLLAQGPVLAARVHLLAQKQSISRNTLLRAAKELHIRKSAGGGPKVEWELPNE